MFSHVTRSRVRMLVQLRGSEGVNEPQWDRQTLLRVGFLLTGNTGLTVQSERRVSEHPRLRQLVLSVM